MFEVWLTKDCNGELRLFHKQPKKENGVWRAKSPHWTEMPSEIEEEGDKLKKDSIRKLIVVTEDEFDELGEAKDSPFDDLDMDDD